MNTLGDTTLLIWVYVVMNDNLMVLLSFLLAKDFWSANRMSEKTAFLVFELQRKKLHG